jgi:hypothetical protein
MDNTINIYCDESCHLEHDSLPVMLLGAIWCPTPEVSRLSKEIQAIKVQHHAAGELKWTKVSKSKLDFYIGLTNWFLAETSLHFRGLVVLNKELLNHERFNKGSHDDFYYKMYFSLLSKILNPNVQHKIFLDIKDTRGRIKLRILKEILCNDKYDFTSQMIESMQNIRSYESQLLQVCDFLLGALSYRHRGLSGNPAKVEIIRCIENGLGRDMLHSTPLGEEKFNLFLFSPQNSAEK